MPPSTATLFEETIQKTGQWLDEITQGMGRTTPQPAYSTLRAVLHVLRDRLTVDEAVNLGAQLPTLVRGFYYEGWRPAGRPLKYRHKKEFLQHVTELYTHLPEEKLEHAVRAVFALLVRHISPGEAQHVRDQMPAEVREL